MINTELIQRKLTFIQTYYQKLNTYLSREVEDILAEETILATIERYFQIVVDTAIDINNHILTHQGNGLPDDLQSTFRSLGELEVLPRDFAEKIAPSVGL